MGAEEQQALRLGEGKGLGTDRMRCEASAFEMWLGH
jgi:hypothetical protein